MKAEVPDSTLVDDGGVVMVPCTTTIRGLPGEVVLEPGDDPFARHCVANVDSIESGALDVLTERIGRLADVRMRQLCEALEVAVGCGR